VIERLLKNQNPLENRNNLRSSSPHLVVGRRPGKRAALSRLILPASSFGPFKFNPPRGSSQARKMLDAPSEDTVAGLRDRRLLCVGLQVGLRRAEIAALKVGDLHQNRGFDSLRASRKGGRRDALAINPQTAARLRVYLERAGHAADIDGPLCRPLKHNGKQREERRRMDPDAIDRVVRKYAAELGLDRGYSAHSMRATFITTALKNGAQHEEVQKAAGHRDPGTTKLYDRRGYNPEKAAASSPRTNPLSRRAGIQKA